MTNIQRGSSSPRKDLMGIKNIVSFQNIGAKENRIPPHRSMR